jgi:hypothetical protein
MRHQMRLILVVGCIVAAVFAATAASVAVNVLTEDLPSWLEFVARNPALWSFVATGAAGAFGVAAWSTQRRYERDTGEVERRPIEAPPGHVPPLTPRYFVRHATTSEIEEILGSEKRVAIVGPGGVGKTQLACAYLAKHASGSDLVWWLRSRHRSVLSADYEAIASALKLDTEGRDVRVAVGSWLAKNSGWFLIFDDVTAESGVQDFLPTITDSPKTRKRQRSKSVGRGEGVVILTSRSKLDFPVSTVQVQDWPIEDSRSFLASQVAGASDDIEDICKELANVPLALDQAAAYMRATSTNASHYLTRLRTFETSQRILDSGRAFNREDSAASTWAISIQAAEVEAAGARDLIALCSFYAGDAIPRHLPQALATVDVDHPGPRRFRRHMSDDLSYDKMLAALARQSLLTLDEEHIYIHGLMQKAVRVSFTVHEARQWTLYAAESLLGLMIQLARSEDALHRLKVAELLLPHALSVAEQAQEKIPQKWPQVHNYPSWIAIRDSARSLEAISFHLHGAVDKTRGQMAALRSLDLAVEAFPFLMGFFEANEGAACAMLCEASRTVAFYAGQTSDAAAAEPALRKAFSLFRSRKVPQRPIPFGRNYRYFHIRVETRFIVLFSLIYTLLVAGKSEEAAQLAREAQDDLARHRYLDPRGRIRDAMTEMFGAPDD